MGPLSCIAAKKCVKQLLWQNVKIIRMLSNWKVEGEESQSGVQKTPVSSQTPHLALLFCPLPPKAVDTPGEKQPHFTKRLV